MRLYKYARDSLTAYMERMEMFFISNNIYEVEDHVAKAQILDIREQTR